MSEKSTVNQKYIVDTAMSASPHIKKDPGLVYCLTHPSTWNESGVVVTVFGFMLLSGIAAFSRFIYHDITVEEPLREAARVLAEQTKHALVQGKLDMPDIFRDLLEEVRMLRKAVQRVVSE